jgi:phage antirepressor YoqD-like protein
MPAPSWDIYSGFHPDGRPRHILFDSATIKTAKLESILARLKEILAYRQEKLRGRLAIMRPPLTRQEQLTKRSLQMQFDEEMKLHEEGERKLLRDRWLTDIVLHDTERFEEELMNRRDK